jgi:DNA (cytosine-5)-methyltransferase 1
MMSRTLIAQLLGFSLLQQNITSEASLRNASHITTFCSAVDYYRPQYAMLENVVSMANKRKGLEDQNVLSQLVACLVGMGYQVNQYIMDSWNYGSGQHRSRIILTIAAPGLEPISHPPHTHSRPSSDTIGRSLGELPNGQRFGHREEHPTPFTHLSASSVTAGLPDIGNGSIHTCVSHPDHRISCPPGPKDRALLRCIPRSPPGCGYAEAYSRGLVPSSLLKPSREIGKAYRRIEASGLIPTITTGLGIHDSRNGAVIHWAQDRPITILEARRAQGYLDEEPIIGDLTSLYRIVGNGVDRKVSFALGVSLLKSVLKDIQKHGIAEIDGFTENMEDMMVDEEEGMVVDAEVEMAIDAEEEKNTRTVNDAASDSSTIHVCVPPRKESTDIINLDRASDAQVPSSPSKTLSPTFERPAQRSESALRARSTDSPGSKRYRDNEEATESTKCAKIVEKDVTQWKRAKLKIRHTRHSGLEIAFAPKQWNRQPEREHSISMW